jgi:hypothetical protein
MAIVARHFRERRPAREDAWPRRVAGDVGVSLRVPGDDHAGAVRTSHAEIMPQALARCYALPRACQDWLYMRKTRAKKCFAACLSNDG